MPARRKGYDLARWTTTTKRDWRAQRTDEQIQQDIICVRRGSITWGMSWTKSRKTIRNASIRSWHTQNKWPIMPTGNRQQVHRAFTFNSFLRLAFEYGADIKYYAHSKVEIGTMDNRNVRIVMRLSSKMGQLVNFTRQKKCIYTYTH